MTTPQPPFVRIPPEFLSLFAGIFKGHIFIGNHRLAQQKKKNKDPPTPPPPSHKDSSRDVGGEIFRLLDWQG
jgi:hypothetical protein